MAAVDHDERMPALPPDVAAMAERGPGWAGWVDTLPGVVAGCLAQWALREDGDPAAGTRSLVVPVRGEDGAAAVLKVSRPEAASEHAHVVLRRWGGHGAVRLLRADPRRGALLLARLLGADLGTVGDAQACEVVAGLYGRLHIAALPQLPAVADVVAQHSERLAALPRNAPIPHRLVEQAVALARDLVADAGAPARVLHTDLHHGNVLADGAGSWVAIAPKALNGDPHYDVAPLLLHRWDGLDGDVRDGVRRRFHRVVDAAGFDEDRARDWVIVRAVHVAMRELQRASAAGEALLTRCVAVAKAVSD
jgi:streptomycin 6-kinase